MLESPPELADLSCLVTPKHAAKWKFIGASLGLSSSELEIIEHDNFHKAEKSCTALWGKWLDSDTTPTWNKVLTAIENQFTESRFCYAHLIVPYYIYYKSLKGSRD